MYDADIPLRSGDSGTDKETTPEFAGLRTTGKKPAEVGWTVGADGGRENAKENGYVEGARSEKKRSTTVEMG